MSSFRSRYGTGVVLLHVESRIASLVSIGGFQILTWQNGCFTNHPLKKWLFRGSRTLALAVKQIVTALT